MPGATELILEEGDGKLGYCSASGAVESDNAGFSGVGYINTDNAVGASITWSVSVLAEAEVRLEFTYANGGADRPGQVLVDEVSQGTALSFPPTADWTTWSAATTSVTLSAGDHTISLAATTPEGLANIDHLAFEGANLSAAACEGDGSPTDPVDGTEPITIWIAGDSTVANGPTPCPSGWGKFFAQEFNDKVTIVNSAVGGRSVRTWLYDISAQKGNDGECIANTDGNGMPVVQSRWTDMLNGMSEGDYLFIQFGINDGSSTCPRHVGGTAFKQEYAMMAKAALARGAHPVFLTPVSAIKCSGSTAVASRGFLTETFDVGAAEGVPVIDLHQLSIQLYQSLSFCPVPGGTVSAATTGPVGDFFCEDHTHFSSAGAAQIAALVAQAVEDAELPLAAYLKK